MKKILGMKNYLIILTMLVILLSPVQASLIVNKVTDEFSLESPYPVDSVKACQCSTRTDILEVKNIGDFEALFTVEILSPIKDMITVSDDTFELYPKEENKVYIYIDAPCDEPLNAFYVAKVKTNYGRSKEIYKDVISKKCQNIKFTSRMFEDTIPPGEIGVVEITLQNVADFTDTFRITPDKDPDNVVLSSEEVSLAPDEETVVYLYVKYPLGDYGEKEIPFTITSEKGNNYAKGVESYEIENDYDFAITTEDFEISACEDVTKKAVITFTNLAESTLNRYYLSLTAPGFAKLSQDSLDLEAGEEDSITLVINPTQEDVGEYDIILTADSHYGFIHKEKSFKLKVKDCFDSTIELGDAEGEFEGKACCGQKIYYLNIRNDGLYEEAYEIIVDSPGWTEVREEDHFVKLRPSQNANIPVTINFPCTDAEQTAFVIVKQIRAPQQTHELRINLESLSKRSCYNIDLLQDQYRINYGTESVPMLLQNTGLEGGTYKLELGELESRFVYLDQEIMEFEAGEMKVLHVHPKNYSAYKEGTYLNKLTLSITLIEADEDLDLDYQRQFWVVLRDKNFLAKAIDYIRGFNYSRIGWCGLLSLILLGLAVILLLIVVVVRFKPNMKIKRIKVKTIKVIKVINIILIFLLIASILMLILLGNPNTSKFYESPSENRSALNHEWRLNTPYQIDLSQYFDDPDMDVLSFTASQPHHIQIDVNEGIATLKPEHNWAGEEQVVFTANDEKGGTADSPIMTLKVLNKKPVGILGYWSAYCTHINIVLFIVLILLVLLFFDMLEEKGYNYYRPKNRRKKKR